MAFSPGTSTIPNTIWPSNPTWNGFDYLFNSPDSNFGKWYVNTLIIAFINMIVGTISLPVLLMYLQDIPLKVKKLDY